ncbi:MAG: 5'-methylthioadenosine phosphorylase [Thiobacillus sp.]|nr:5'-methylthioadenosine phosphorylase [Thiobacillus sp.]
MLAVIGGSGLYELDGMTIEKRHDIETPFGEPSDSIVEGVFQNEHILFLPRHGRHHHLLPHEVNYRANIFALKQLGARRIFSVSAAGSLREELRPGDMALASQYFDHTRGRRPYSFFGDGVTAHVSTALPACPALSNDIAGAAKRLNLTLHLDKTYGCVEGPRLGTRAESYFLRDSAGCDLVGMTNVPEVFLAREAQIAYCTVCVITDYDCWMDDPTQHVSVEKFLEIYKAGVEKAKDLLTELVRQPLTDTPADVRHALKSAVLTPDDHLGPAQREWLRVLRA